MKKGQYVKTGVAELISVLVYALLVFVLANMGFGFYSLIVAYFVRVSVKLVVVLNLAVKFYDILSGFDITEIKRLGRMAVAMAFQGVFLFSTSNTDRYFANIVGGVAGVGLYTRALKLVQMPMNQIVRNISSVLFVEFSNKQTDVNYIRKLYCQALLIISLLFFPLSAFVASFSVEIVTIIYGENWSEMAPLLEVLVFGAGLSSLSIIVGDLLKSRGVVYRELISNFISLLVLITLSTYYVKPYGIVGLGWAFFAAKFIFLILQMYLVARLIDVGFGSYFKVFSMPILIGLSVLTIISIVKHLVLSQFMALFIVCTSLVMALLVIVIAIYYFDWKDAVMSLF